jgi:hypothetical protein
VKLIKPGAIRALFFSRDLSKLSPQLRDVRVTDESGREAVNSHVYTSEIGMRLTKFTKPVCSPAVATTLVDAFARCGIGRSG